MFRASARVARSGECDGWTAKPRGRLALIILCDQLSRCVFRDTARAYAFDERTCRASLDGLESGDHRQLRPIEQAFFVAPLVHAEDPGHQRIACDALDALALNVPPSLGPVLQAFRSSAHRHRAIIECSEKPWRRLLQALEAARGSPSD